MSPLHKKCVLFSVALHGLLLAVVVVGPGFLPAPPPTLDLAPIDFVPTKLVDDLLSGGGSPAPAAPKPAPNKPPADAPPPLPIVKAIEPAPPAPKDPPLGVEKPVTPKDVSAPEETAPDDSKSPPEDDDAVDLTPPKKPRPSPKINLTPIVRKPTTRAGTANGKKRAADDEAEQAAAAAAAASAWQKNVGRTFSAIQGGLSGGVSVEVGTGTGGRGGGEAFANWAQYVTSIYDRAWLPPDDLADGLTVTVRIVIRRDGTVDSDAILKRSHNLGMDRSVSEVLARIRSVPPFPETAKESTRALTINFKKRLL